MPLDDNLLEIYGDFYSSEYVIKNQPWILEIPFHEWLGRQIKRKKLYLEDIGVYMEEAIFMSAQIEHVPFCETA